VSLSGLDRRWWLWAGLLTLLTVGLCLAPLVGRPGFELSVVVALAAAIAAGDVGARASSLGSGLRRALLLLLSPLAVAAANSLRVKVCDWGTSLAFYALLPGVSVVVASLWGRAVRLVVRRPALASHLTRALGLVSLLHTIWWLYAEPPVFAFDPVFGYWPGPIYDEALGIPSALLWARLMHVVAAAAALAVASLVSAPAPRRLEGPRLLAAPVLVGLCAALYAAGPRLGFRHDARSIQAALGRTVAARGLLLHVDRSVDREEVAVLLDDLRWARRVVADNLGLDLASLPTLSIWVYRSRAQRRELMGAEGTTVAHPWSHEVHFVRPRPGSPLVVHELTHVLAAPLAGRWTGVPWRGGQPAMGLVEGLAVAIAGVETGPGLHESVAAMRKAGLAPRPSEIWGLSGFYRQAGPRAYAVMGSFVRFLLSRYGAAAVRESYRTGDVAGVVGVPLAELEEAWAGWLDRSMPIPPGQVARAELRYRRASLFERVCPHEIALRRREAARHGGDGALLRAWQQIVAWDPGDPAHLLRLADVQVGLEDLSGARETLRGCAEHPSASPALQAVVDVRLADLVWLEGDRAAAARGYRGARGQQGRESAERMVRAKLLASESGAAGDVVREWLLGRRLGDSALLALHEAAQDGGALPAYLLGRRLFNGRDWEVAAVWLERAADAGLGDPLLAGENLRLLGQARYRAGEREAAARAFQALLGAAPSPGYTEGAAMWLWRCREAGNAPPSPLVP